MRIPIVHVDCSKQKVHHISESFIDLNDNHLVYKVNGYIAQWNEELGIISEEPNYIYDEDIALKGAITGIQTTTSRTQEPLFFLVKILYGTYGEIYVRFETQGKADEVAGELKKWLDLK